MSTPSTIGLALGSGGARGLAHIGVIKALRKNNIPIDYIAGTSIGAIIGGMYALTEDIDEIEKIAKGLDLKKIASLIDPNFTGGLMKGDKIKTFLETYFGKAQFKNTRIPFAAVATDYRTGQPVIIREGNMCDAIRASMSIPLAFKPVKVGKKLLVDGGLSIPVPVSVVKAMGADKTIAVNLDAYYESTAKKLTYYSLGLESLGILRHHLAAAEAKTADILIQPDLKGTLWFDFQTAQKFIKKGEKAVNDQSEKIKAL